MFEQCVSYVAEIVRVCVCVCCCRDSVCVCVVVKIICVCVCVGAEIECVFNEHAGSYSSTSRHKHVQTNHLVWGN